MSAAYWCVGCLCMEKTPGVFPYKPNHDCRLHVFLYHGNLLPHFPKNFQSYSVFVA